MIALRTIVAFAGLGETICRDGRERARAVTWRRVVLTASVALVAAASPIAEQDHQAMMDRLGITALVPGHNGDEAAPDHANYDEAKANPFPDLPDPLRLPDGRTVTDAATWWRIQRPRIAEDYAREVYGRIPAGVPKVTWHVASTEHRIMVGRPVTLRRMIGHVDNRIWPAITVDVRLTVVLPDVARPAPVLILFTYKPDDLQSAKGDLLIGDGWGYAVLDTSSVQADTAEGLRQGIIGLVAKGGPRQPDEWGALRAWGWGASRAFDAITALPQVDRRHIGIEGVSRWGKAALVAMAYDQRFAIGLIGSSGKGGATPLRRDFGEGVGNLASVGAYHWMAGNFLKYAAASGRGGAHTANDLPVDSSALIALCAPRLTFISYGVPAAGDARWLDQRGSYMATVDAGRVFRLLGAGALPERGDYRTAQMPPVNSGLLDGALAWRQHDGGHTDLPNLASFLAWADARIGRAPDKKEAAPKGGL